MAQTVESACNMGDPGLIPGLRRFPREENGNLFLYSCLENPMDGGAWQVTVHGVAKSQTRLSNFTFHVCIQFFPGGLVVKNPPQYNGFDPWIRKIYWTWKWQPTPVLLTGKSHGQRSLVGYSPWGCKRVGHVVLVNSNFL